MRSARHPSARDGRATARQVAAKRFLDPLMRGASRAAAGDPSWVWSTSSSGETHIFERPARKWPAARLSGPRATPESHLSDCTPKHAVRQPAKRAQSPCLSHTSTRRLRSLPDGRSFDATAIWSPNPLHYACVNAGVCLEAVGNALGALAINLHVARRSALVVGKPQKGHLRVARRSDERSQSTDVALPSAIEGRAGLRESGSLARGASPRASRWRTAECRMLQPSRCPSS